MESFDLTTVAPSLREILVSQVRSITKAELETKGRILPNYQEGEAKRDMEGWFKATEALNKAIEDGDDVLPLEALGSTTKVRIETLIRTTQYTHTQFFSEKSLQE